jgi:hypothetical protein
MEPLEDIGGTTKVPWLFNMELAIELFPSVILLVFGVHLYAASLLVALLDRSVGDSSIIGWLTVTVVGGVLGIRAILFARRPERLRARPRLMRAGLYASAGLCAEATFIFGLVSAGGVPLGFDLSTILLVWVLMGPVLVGLHSGCRVMAWLNKRTTI